MIHAFADIEIDTSTQELKRSGEPVHVEPQVLAVLEYLIAHRDRVVTKIELLDEVWGDRFVSESALTSRIKSARQVCGDSGKEQSIIRTVHGRGYRFVADVRQVAAGSGTAPPSQALSQTGRVGALVGRSTELQLLRAAISETSSGTRAGVFVTGESGIGKSALVAEFLEGLDDPGSWFVIRGQCLQQRGGAEPYFALLDALNRLARNEGSDIVDLIERVAPSWLAQLPSVLDLDRSARIERRLLGGTPQRMLREGADVIEELAHLRPVVLTVEDLHWADGPTLDVLELLLQRTEHSPLLVVGTSRPGSTVDSLIASLTATGRATEIALTALGDEEVEALVVDFFDGSHVDDELLEIVRQRGEGVPLFAQEILATWASRGQIADEDGKVNASVPRGELEATVPDNLRALIAKELLELDDSEVELLEVAAIAGAGFDTAAVAAALEQPLGDVEDRLATMSRRLHYVTAGGGVEWPDGTVSTRYEFNHDLYRQALQNRTSPARKRLLHDAVGKAIERGYQDRIAEVVVVLAHHFGEAGDAQREVAYLRQAGEQAAARSAHSHAVDFMEAGLKRVADIADGHERDEAELHLRLSIGPSLVATRGWLGESVLENYTRAMDLAESGSHPSEAALARYGMATVTELRGQYGLTEDILTPLVSPDEEELQIEARELMACSMFHQGHFEQSLESALSALDRWEDGDYSEVMARLAEHPAASCNSWAAMATWFLGDAEQSLILADRSIEQGERNLYSLSTVQVQRGFLHQYRLEPELCRMWAAKAEALAEEQGFPMCAMQAKIMIGWAEALTGEPERGIADLVDGLERYEAFGARLKVPYFLGLLADASLAAGNAHEALDHVDRALADMAETTRSFFYEPELHRLRARALLASGEVPEARNALDKAFDLAQTGGSAVLSLRIATTRLHLERDHGDPGPWVELLTELLATFDPGSETVDTAAARAALAT